MWISGMTYNAMGDGTLPILPSFPPLTFNVPQGRHVVSLVCLTCFDMACTPAWNLLCSFFLHELFFIFQESSHPLEFDDFGFEFSTVYFSFDPFFKMNYFSFPRGWMLLICLNLHY